jgi:catechol 2,3-dioxygenase-like lactoylglutathione lyase family enzyme
MAATQEPRSAEELGLKIDGVNHLTLPVRDHDKARKFYIEVLGAEVRREPSWDSVRAGRSNSTALAVRICEGAELDLFYQPFGMAQPDQQYPRHAFYVQAPEELDAFRARLEAVGTPTALITRQEPTPPAGQPCRAELHFNDPDGNHLQIDCRGYPFSDKVGTATVDPWDLQYAWRDWPSAPRGG